MIYTFKKIRLRKLKRTIHECSTMDAMDYGVIMEFSVNIQMEGLEPILRKHAIFLQKNGTN